MDNVLKLHVLLVCTMIAIGAYMFFLYKEIKYFQLELESLKKQITINRLQANDEQCKKKDNKDTTCSITSNTATTNTTGTTNNTTRTSNNTTGMTNNTTSPIQPSTVHVVQPAAVMIIDNVDNDIESVTSNEIKDILTNIQTVDYDETTPDEALEEATISFEDEIIMTEKKLLPDYSSMTDEELQKTKYDDLRNYLRSQGVNVKGPKQDLILKIKEIIQNKKS